jgi:phosphoglycerol transferase MdoB-like AlkP superfamily enzyme
LVICYKELIFAPLTKEKMQKKNNVKQLIFLFLTTISLLFVCRLFFWFYNQNSFVQFSGLEVLIAFLTGFIFDSVVLAYVFGLFILLYLFPLSFKLPKILSFLLKLSFIALCFFILFLNTVDTLYFPFAGKRSGIELFSLMLDPANPLLSYVIDFWYLVFAFFVFLFILSRYIYPKIAIQSTFYSAKNILYFVLMIPILFLGLRGGWGLKPLKSNDASIWVSPGLEPIAISTPFQLISSIDAKKPENPFDSFSNMISTYKSIYKLPPSPFINSKPNIVLIILESFGREYIGFLNQDSNTHQSLTPFLDSLALHSLVLPHCYANGTRSVDAVPVIYAGIPPLLDETFIYSWYQANTVKGLPYYLSELGYQSAFFHGAANGTMGFESFLKRLGPIQYYGLTQYDSKNKSDYDGHWGVFDLPFLEFTQSKLENMKEPYFSGIFTLSSHHPYTVPAPYNALLPKGELPIHQSVAYADLALQNFFYKRAKHPHHNNTVYIFIGDHSSQAKNEYFNTPKGKMELFCMVYDPRGIIKPGIQYKTTQQMDLYPSIMHLAGYTKKPVKSWGRSFFDSTNGLALFRLDNQYYAVRDEHLLSFQLPHKTKYEYLPKPFFPFENSKKQTDSAALSQDFLSIIHSFFNAMENNRLNY